jgi:hypothetical protein
VREQLSGDKDIVTIYVNCHKLLIKVNFVLVNDLAKQGDVNKELSTDELMMPLTNHVPSPLS